MGPPKVVKVRVTKLSYSTRQDRWDYFEYRLNQSTQTYYYFNPWTGETVVQTGGTFDRNFSMWAPAEGSPLKNVQTLRLLPQPFQSRLWGRRRFHGWENERDAAAHMTAVARGFLARKRLSEYYRNRYSTLLCPFSSYLYFFDSENPKAETAWQKPRLALPDGIIPYVEPDEEDYMKGEKFSHIDFALGPLYTTGKPGKGNKVQAEASIVAFHKPNPWRDIAIWRQEDIDIENSPIGTVVSWLDGTKSTSIEITEYAFMRAAVARSDWNEVLHFMRSNPDNLLVQVYGLHNFAKREVPLDRDGILDFCSHDVMTICIDVINDNKRTYTGLHKVFALNAMHNLLAVRAGRVEYLDMQKVQSVQGERREMVIEQHIATKLKMLSQYIKVIPMDKVVIQAKLTADEAYARFTGAARRKDKPRKIEILSPTQRATDIIERCLRCLAILACEEQTRETFAYILAADVIECMKKCAEEPVVQLHGLRLLYNFCYRCEGGQFAVLDRDVKSVLESVRYNHAGDFDVMSQLRRLELSLNIDGWRGYVEDLIEQEMKGQEIADKYLLSPFSSTASSSLAKKQQLLLSSAGAPGSNNQILGEENNRLPINEADDAEEAVVPVSSIEKFRGPETKNMLENGGSPRTGRLAGGAAIAPITKSSSRNTTTSRSMPVYDVDDAASAVSDITFDRA